MQVKSVETESGLNMAPQLFPLSVLLDGVNRQRDPRSYLRKQKTTENFPFHYMLLKVLLFEGTTLLLFYSQPRYTLAVPLLTGHISDMGPNSLTSAAAAIYRCTLKGHFSKFSIQKNFF